MRAGVIIVVVFVIAVGGLEDDGPTGGEDGMVDVQVIGFEGEAGEDGGNSDGLSIGQVDHGWRHDGQSMCISQRCVNI